MSIFDRYNSNMSNMDYKKKLENWRLIREYRYNLYLSGMSVVDIAKRYHVKRQAIVLSLTKVNKDYAKAKRAKAQ